VSQLPPIGSGGIPHSIRRPVFSGSVYSSGAAGAAADQVNLSAEATRYAGRSGLLNFALYAYHPPEKGFDPGSIAMYAYHPPGKGFDPGSIAMYAYQPPSGGHDPGSVFLYAYQPPYPGSGWKPNWHFPHLPHHHHHHKPIFPDYGGGHEPGSKIMYAYQPPHGGGYTERPGLAPLYAYIPERDHNEKGLTPLYAYHPGKDKNPGLAPLYAYQIPPGREPKFIRSFS